MSGSVRTTVMGCDPMPDALAREHAVLVRQMGKTQARLSAMLAEQEARLQSLTRELVRMRGLLLCHQTAALWGMRLACASDSARYPAAR